MEAGAWPPHSSIPCRLILNGADLTELSLAENVQREAMHPADEFLAFQKLIANGMCVADIAARFGVNETVVSKRLALARVSPALLDKYRAGEMNLELLQAFTLSDDHTVQDQNWDELHRQPWNRLPRTVRSLLSQDAIPAHDQRVQFVGLDKYEASGGLVKRDLFSREDEAGVYVLDPGRAYPEPVSGAGCRDACPRLASVWLGLAPLTHRKLFADLIHASEFRGGEELAGGLSGLGEVLGSAIQEHVEEGITDLKLAFSLTRPP